MTTYGKICRICSSPANYDVFAKIPTYLHANSHEFLNWQQPINVLLEEVTGLKVSLDDGLPQSICALCISYLKHAATFRTQAISNALTLKAVQLLRQQRQKAKNGGDAQKRQTSSLGDKECLLITTDDLSYAEERELDANLLANSCQQDQDKVRKQLLNNNFQASAPSQQSVEQQLRYLNLLFDKDANSGLRGKRGNNAAGCSRYEMLPLGDADEDFQTTSTVSSDDNEDADAENKSKYNIFSYREKNFEEDDIMDMDELREAITINIPESCKERKCRACARRFMFEDTYREHMDSCIEYKFMTYIEEINRLLEIRRSKAISPHEFIRRMIFCLRKTCDWLKANCDDMLLPDLLANGEESVAGEDKNANAKVETSKMQRILLNTPPPAANTTKSKAKVVLNPQQESSIISLFATPKQLRSGTATPITISNNILYEIERSQSRNSNQTQQQNQMDLSYEGRQLKKPIAVFATTSTTTTAATLNYNVSTDNDKSSGGDNGVSGVNSTSNKCDEERLTFLQKLQQAGCQTPPLSNKTGYANTTPFLNTPTKPLLSVRKDLLHSAPPPLPELPATPTSATKFSARCNPCHILFETLAALELHNAMHHNSMATTQQQQPVPVASNANAAELTDAEQQRKRIIALFEDDENDEV